MYAIVQIGGNQYRIAEGDSIDILHQEGTEGKNITLDKILLVANGKDIKVGQPYLKGVKVTAKVMRHLLGEKKLSFKFRKRKESKTLRGHRQQMTTLSITKIAAE